MIESFKKFYLNIKENFVLIAIVPTILGGIIQLFKLGSISINLIRFFSISQLITDGLILLLFISIPLTIYILLFLKVNMDYIYDDDDDFKPSDLIRTTLDKIRFGTMALIILLSLIGFSEIIKFESLYLLTCFFFMYNFVVFLLLILFRHFLKKHYLIEIYLIFSGILLFMISLYSFNKNYQKTDNIVNFNLLITQLEKEKCYSKRPEILYFNDKYLFIEVAQQNKKSILIKKIDDLFDE